MFQGIANFASMLKQAHALPAKMQELQEKLKDVRVTGMAGGGLVTVEASGKQQLLSCRIDPSLLDGGDREMLEDLVIAACNQALEKAKQAAADEISQMAGGMPGLGEALRGMGLS